MTNVTAQRMVGVAPAGGNANTAGDGHLPWTTLDHLTSIQQAPNNVQTGKSLGTNFSPRVDFSG